MLIPLVSVAGGDGAAAATRLPPIASCGDAPGDFLVTGTACDLGEPVAPTATYLPLLRAARCVVGPLATGPDAAAGAAAFLDAGAAIALFDCAGDGWAAAAAAVAGLSSLPRARVAVLVPGGLWADDAALDGTASTALRALGAAAATFVLVAEDAAAVSAAAATAPRWAAAVRAAAAAPTVLVILCRPATAGAAGVAPAAVGALHRAGVHVAAAAGTADAPPPSEGAADVAACLVACARTDRPDGLFPTVVVDECGKALGLVYSDGESVREALRCRRGVYHSRSRCVGRAPPSHRALRPAPAPTAPPRCPPPALASLPPARGGLWRKGDTSGAWQDLVSVRLDCDSDALLFTVVQRGAPPAFCHTGTRGCWGHDAGLSALQATLRARMADAPPGSYTARLFRDPALLRHKLLEEAQELAEATAPDDVAAEAADVLYFALVACARAGVGLADVEAHLDRRALKLARRPGDAKPARIAAAAAELGRPAPAADARPDAAVAAGNAK